MSSIDTLKDNLLRAVDAEYNVIKADIVLDIICQLEKMEITKDQLQTTRLGREINTIRQKIDARRKTSQQNEKSLELFIEIAQRAKKLLRSWQGLLNTSQTDSSSIKSSPINADIKPRLILKVKFNSTVTKRKRDSHSINRINSKRKKIETNNTLPRLKTTQQLLLEMQMNQPTVLLTKTSTVDAILQKKIIDESLQETIKLDYSALHHGRDVNHNDTNSTLHYQKQLSPPSNTIVTPGSISKRQNTNWENGSSAGSPVSPVSSLSSSSTTSLPVPSAIPDPPLIVPSLSNMKQLDLENICASYNTVADLVEDHRRRILAKHDSRELEDRPDLLLVPIDQLAFVYEKEKTTKELNLPAQTKYSSITAIEKLHQPSDLIALPFIDCPMEFDLILDELVIENPTMNI